MRPPKVASLAVAGAFCLLGARAGQAVSFRPLDYFLNTTKGLGKPTSCIATSRTNKGTYNRTFAYSAGHCPGVPLYIWTKGAPQWGEEHFFAEDGFIKLLDDTGDDLSHPGNLDLLHGLLESAGSPGLKVFVDGIVNNYAYIDHPGYFVSEWRGNTCPSTHIQVQGPFVGFEENEWVGTVSSWLWDCRAGRPCQNGQKYAVEVMERSGGGPQPGDPVDHFWFARWKDPMDGNQWRGLGPIKFWCDGGQPGWCAPPVENHFLVDCSVSPVCFNCP